MENFGSICQFREVISQVIRYSKNHDVPVPTLKFVGTVKLHGTNSAVVYDNNSDTFTFQSREREITVDDDNAGFAKFATENVEIFLNYINQIKSLYICNKPSKIAVFGEFIGPGIQKNVAISKLPQKRFVIFAIRLVYEDRVVELSPSEITLVEYCIGDSSDRIDCIYSFPTWEIDIDFQIPQLSQNELVKLTQSVEDQCPVGHHFGLEGNGEGIVWENHETGLCFKVKGEKHSNTKIKTIKEIAEVDIQRMNSAKEFVERAVTTNRLEQGIFKMGEKGLPIEETTTSDYIKWVVSDVLSEESDVLLNSGLTPKDVGKLISNKAKEFWFAYLNNINGLD